MNGSALVVRSRETASPPYSLRITPSTAGWTYSGLSVLELAASQWVRVESGEAELLVLSLRGACRVTLDGQSLEVAGRASVFAGPSDFVYVPRDSSVTVMSDEGGRFALPSAVCRRQLPFRHASSDTVAVELRGAGRASRQVNNFCTPEAFETDKLIACEVLTPGGNWSSYPPHKHDERSETESELEEIYYFEVADGPQGHGLGYQRAYGHDHSGTDVCAEVRTGDAVLIPDGWHGPSMAAPGYDLYYLNVMAGPGEERAWLICDDPAHAWVRETWASQAMDSRLPFWAQGGQR